MNPGSGSQTLGCRSFSSRKTTAACQTYAEMSFRGDVDEPESYRIDEFRKAPAKASLAVARAGRIVIGQPFLNGGLLVCTTGYELLVLFYAARDRRRQQPAAARISSIKVAGSGIATFADVLALLPMVWPKWNRQSSYPCWPLMPVLRHTT